MRNKKLLLISSIVVPVIVVTFSLIAINPLKNSKKEFFSVVFDTKGGSLIDTIQVERGSKIKKPNNPSKNGYLFSNWYFNGSIWDFSKSFVESDMTLTATWNLENYNIAYDFAGGHTSQSYKTNYTIKSDFKLVRPTKDTGVFTGWFDENGVRIDEIHPGMFGDLKLMARWVDNLSIISLDETKGSIEVFGDSYNDKLYTVKNIPVSFKDHTFKGWYDEKDNLLSTDTSYSFLIDGEATKYIRSKYYDDTEESQWNINHGVIPSFANDSETEISFGMYPQTNINDPLIISKLVNSTLQDFGYYYYNHEYYIKKTAVLARDFSTHELLDIRKFDNGSEIIEGNEYWFKIEPLIWKVLQKNDEVFLLSKKLIDVQKYHNGQPTKVGEMTYSANNYKYSDIRKWLNNDFHDQCFFFNNLPLNLIDVDNSPSSTATPDSGFSCENTNDKVTILSYKDYRNPLYGFSELDSSTQTRIFYTTDYCRASKANYSTGNNSLFSGYTWTRSPVKTNYSNGYCASRSNKMGVLNTDYVGITESCIQPAISICL